jgi:hypothetical protein
VSIPIIIFGGELHGTEVDRLAVPVMHNRRPNLKYDPTGETRPFCTDYEARVLTAKTMAITVPVIVDGVPEDEVLDVLQDTVRKTFIDIVRQRPRP